MSRYCLSSGPTDSQIYDACQRSVDVLEELDGFKAVKEGIHPYVSCIILDKYGHILSDKNGHEIIELTDAGEVGGSRQHAEAKALLRVLEDERVRSKAHTVITTLEPCSYRNIDKHPEAVACAKLISYSGIKQVIIGTLDPAAEISGRGAKILEQWEVYFNIFPQEIHDSVIQKNEKYLKNNRYYKDSNRFYINPTDEDNINYAPKSIRDFIDSESTLPEIWKNEGKDQASFEKKLFPDEKYISLSDKALEIIDNLKKVPVGKSGIDGFSMFEKISQYLGLSLDRDAGYRSSIVMRYLVDWWLEKNKSKSYLRR